MGHGISASYAAGTVSGDDNVGGLVGYRYRGTISASYYDRQASVLSVAVGSDDRNNNGAIDDTERATAGAEGKTTADLMAPTGYAGIYADWNLDLDNADGDNDLTTGDDDPWDFGASDRYPALKTDFNGDNTATWAEFGYQVRKPLLLTAAVSGTQATLTWPDVTETAWPGTPQVSYALYRDGDVVAGYGGSSRTHTDTGLTHEQTYRYRVALLVGGLEAVSSAASVFVPVPRADEDGDGLIDISSLAQLNAVRWDLDSDGLADADATTANRSDYNTAFPLPESGKVCNAGGEGEGACVGYELTADLDFDENGDGEITDADATYWNGGAGWARIGFSSSYIGATPRAFTGVFDGGGHAIANLYVNRPSTDYIGLFGYIGSGGEVRNLGLAGVDVTGDDYVGGLVGRNYGGRIIASYAVGTVSGRDDAVGGLVGNNSGTISGSYAAGTVSGDGGVGGLVGSNNGTIGGSYAAGTVSGGNSGGSSVGGLAGSNYGGRISGSFAAGTVTGGDDVGGLVGSNSRGTISASYHDSQTSGLSVAVGSDDRNNNGAIDGTERATAGAEGKTTAELMGSTDYTGIYADWNLDLGQRRRRQRAYHRRRHPLGLRREVTSTRR